MQDIIDFVKPYYDKKDIMHDLSHIERIKQLALKFLENHPEADKILLETACYLHGVVNHHEEQVKEFLLSHYSKEKTKKIITVAKESHRNTEAESIEGKILHDANILEGGKTFFIVKSLISGSLKGQDLKEIIDYVEDEIIGKLKVYLPGSKSLLKEKEEFARRFIEDLKKERS